MSLGNGSLGRDEEIHLSWEQRRMGMLEEILMEQYGLFSDVHLQTPYKLVSPLGSRSKS